MTVKTDQAANRWRNAHLYPYTQKDLTLVAAMLKSELRFHQVVQNEVRSEEACRHG